jgi:hypothetical protein
VGRRVALQGDVRAFGASWGSPEGASARRREGRSRSAGGLEKGGLVEALGRAGLDSGQAAWHSDEMRLGLRGQSRKVLAPKGVKVVQRLQLRYEWSYLVLAVSPLSGEIRWEWIERMRKEQLRPVLEGWALEAVVWDRAPSHRANTLEELSTTWVFLPSYSPELNPAERIFEEVRRRAEGEVYEDLEAKRREAESYLEELRDDPERVKSLCGWRWLTASLESVPTHAANQ